MALKLLVPGWLLAWIGVAGAWWGCAGRGVRRARAAYGAGAGVRGRFITTSGGAGRPRRLAHHRKQLTTTQRVHYCY